MYLQLNGLVNIFIYLKCYSKNNYIERVEEEKGRINDKASVVKY